LDDVPFVRPPTPPPDLNLEDWSASIERLRALRPQALYLPHFGAVTDALDTHFDELRARLYAWGDVVAQGMRVGKSDAELAYDLALASDDAIASAAQSEDFVARYELASNYLMSAQGYVRYYRKTRPNVLAQ
jgi:hypothetical protein